MKPCETYTLEDKRTTQFNIRKRSMKYNRRIVELIHTLSDDDSSTLPLDNRPGHASMHGQSKVMVVVEHISARDG